LSGHTGITRHSPRNGFNGYFVISPVLRAFWPPSPALLLADLTPASGCQDHTILHVRFKRRRLRHHPRPPHPAPRFVTLRNAPLSGRDGCEYAGDLGIRKSRNGGQPCDKTTRRANRLITPRADDMSSPIWRAAPCPKLCGTEPCHQRCDLQPETQLCRIYRRKVCFN
jgi:hypothetical protein